MKKTILFLFAVAVQTTLFAQKYFPEGTKWTEIRLDREKYDSWYSRVGDEWMPNFETVEYLVQGTYIEDFWEDGDFKTFNCVHTNSAENPDSLFLLLYEGGHEWEDNDWVEVTLCFFSGGKIGIWPGQAYMFNWEIGTRLYSRTIEASNRTGMDNEDEVHEFGTITGIKEGNFGGARPLKYVEMNGVRIIQGIGVTEWNGRECLFGPVDPYKVRCILQPGGGGDEIRPYHSMLVHFERGGEVLYDVWPEKGGNGIDGMSSAECKTSDTLYDLSGRRVTEPQKGIYIQNGRKRVR
ncbi:MAG: hypothetical protein IJ762_09060 [Bacteroidaceae bacterium]|nr:hypothetical protein [Bacteroidaceae bacterium]MBR1789319.1 hypothetical protein [Bacteroidaceae bacterium]